MKLALTFAAMSLFAGCDDKETPPPPPPVDAAALVCPGTGTTGFLANCTENDQCTSCLCKTFGHLEVCSQACTGPADCPAPSAGCSGGFCMP
jgi:hypothetical protein